MPEEFEGEPKAKPEEMLSDEERQREQQVDVKEGIRSSIFENGDFSKAQELLEGLESQPRENLDLNSCSTLLNWCRGLLSSLGEAKQKYSNNAQFQNFESSLAEFKDNIQVRTNELVISNENPLFARPYTILIKERPELASIPVRTFTAEEKIRHPKTGGRFVHGEWGPDKLVFPTGESHLDEFALTPEGKPTLETIASKIGIPVETLTKHENTPIIDIFIFLHEAGHAQDFLRSGLTREKWSVKRKEELKTLPGGGHPPAEYITLCRRQNLPITAEHIKTVSEAYRNLPSERYADQFAVNLMKKYWTELGLTKNIQKTS